MTHDHGLDELSDAELLRRYRRSSTAFRMQILVEDLLGQPELEPGRG